MAKAMGLIFFTVLRHFSLRGEFQSDRFTSALLCVPFIFADSKKCQFGGGTWWLPFTMEIVFFLVITKELFKQLLIRNAV